MKTLFLSPELYFGAVWLGILLFACTPYKPPEQKDPNCQSYLAVPGEPCKKGLSLYFRTSEAHPLCLCEMK